jgi:hypothetical protein
VSVWLVRGLASKTESTVLYMCTALTLSSVRVYDFRVDRLAVLQQLICLLVCEALCVFACRYRSGNCSKA